MIISSLKYSRFMEECLCDYDVKKDCESKLHICKCPHLKCKAKRHECVCTEIDPEYCLNEKYHRCICNIIVSPYIDRKFLCRSEIHNCVCHTVAIKCSAFIHDCSCNINFKECRLVMTKFHCHKCICPNRNCKSH